jgi:hypothetical protein
MKYIIIFLAYSVQTFAQFTAVFQPMAWHNEVYAVAEANGFYYVAGNCRNSMNGIANDVMFLTTFDGSGNLVNQYFSDSSAPGFAPMHCHSLLAVPGGFVMAGDSNIYFYVCKIDDLGNLLWSYTGNLDLAQEIVSAGFGYIISGDSGAVALDLNGNFLWSAPNLSGDIDASLVGYVSAHAGTLELHGVDLNGLSPWVSVIGIPQIWQPQITSTLTNLFVAGNKADSMFIVCTDLYGALQWTKGFYGPQNRVSNIRTCSGGLIITGINSGFAFLIRTDFNGNILWQQSYQPVDCNSSGYDAIQTSDGNYFWAGSQYNYVDQISQDFAIKGIDSLNTPVIEIAKEDIAKNTTIFDLQGREMSGDLPSGCYVHDRKVIYIEK